MGQAAATIAACGSRVSSGRFRSEAPAVALLLTATALASGSAAEGVSASHAAAKARWQELPGLEIGHGRALTDAAWSVGRAWFVVGGSKKLTMASARVRGRALTSFETTDVQAPLSWYPIVLGSDVLYPTGRKS